MPSYQADLTQKRSWLKATAVSSAAMSMVGAVPGEGLALSAQSNRRQPNRDAVLPVSVQPEGYAIARTARSLSQSAPVLPNLAQADSATFSNSSFGNSSGSFQLLANAVPPASTAQPSLITQTQDGNWTLSTDISSDNLSDRRSAAASQSVISDLAEQTARTRQACSGRRCRGLAYIDSKLPEAQAEVENLQAQLADFETHRAQQNMEGYQELLTDRIFEIAQQKQDLLLSTERNQRRITQLKTALVQMDADLEMAERSLEADDEYQAAWNRLLQAEQNLMNEFSQVKLDGTELNEIYSDYQYHQQQAQTLAGEALGNYIMRSPTVPSFITRSPDALNLLQELATATHEYRTQKLRQTTISQIQKRLNDRESQLVGDIGGYESLQQELTTAKKIVEEYEKERAYILSQQSGATGQGNLQQAAAQAAAQAVERSSTALDRARRLAPLLPAGTVSQRVVFAVLMLGAIAAIAAYRRDRKVSVPQLALQAPQPRDYSFEPTALQQANLMAAIKLPALRFSASQLQPAGAPISNPEEKRLAAAPSVRLHGEEPVDAGELSSLEEILASVTHSPEPELDDFEQRILAELLEITGQSPRLLAAAEDAAAKASERITVEMMVNDLNEALGSLTLESNLAQAIQEKAIASVELSVDDVDLFAEHAVQWILKDLGVSSGVAPIAAALDKAEAEARGWSEADVAEIEAITIESLEIVQPTRSSGTQNLGIYKDFQHNTPQQKAPQQKAPQQKAPQQKVPQQGLGEVSREFATVAA